MTPLLVLLLAGVAWGDVCGDNHLCAISQPLIVYPMDRGCVPEITNTVQLAENKPTYVVEVTSVCVKSSGYVLTSNPPIIPCEKWESQYAVAGIGFWSKDQADDMAEALNQARRRRVK